MRKKVRWILQLLDYMSGQNGKQAEIQTWQRAQTHGSQTYGDWISCYVKLHGGKIITRAASSELIW